MPLRQAVDTDEGDLVSQQGKRRAEPDEAEEGLSETEGERLPRHRGVFSTAPHVSKFWTGRASV